MAERLPSVDIVLVQGVWPNKSSAIWKIEGLRLALGIQDLRKEEKKTFPFDFTNDDDCLRFQRGLEGFRKLGLVVWKKT